MENCYTRFQFVQDASEAFEMGDINYPEMDALMTSWPEQIEAVYYASPLPFEIDEFDLVDEHDCDCCDCARDEAEDKALFGNDFMVGCSTPNPNRPVFNYLNPIEAMRTYHYPDGFRVEVTGVTAICVRESGYHFLETLDGEKAIVPPGWRCITLDVEDWSF